LASKDKNRFTELNGALDRALAVFSVSLASFASSFVPLRLTTVDGPQSSEIIETAERVRASTQELTVLVATVHRVEDDVTMLSAP
jgi:hypothetical protein